MKNLLSVFVGGAFGAILRYQFSVAIQGNTIPFATITVNLLGSFLLGFITTFYMTKYDKPWLITGLGAGFCGGFTTMSTFTLDIFFLFQDLQYIYGILYLFASLFGSLICAFFGLSLGLKMSKERKERP